MSVTKGWRGVDRRPQSLEVAFSILQTNGKVDGATQRKLICDTRAFVNKRMHDSMRRAGSIRADAACGGSGRLQGDGGEVYRLRGGDTSFFHQPNLVINNSTAVHQNISICVA